MMSKAQIKMQEMAFVLIALMVFFALITLFYLAFKMQSLRDIAGNIREQEAQALVRKLASTPELRWGGCSGCLDLDKAIVLKERFDKNKSLEQLWDLEYLELETIYPEKENKMCTFGNYPNCNKLILLKRTDNYGKAYSTFVSLCRWDYEGNYEKCELGKIYAAGRLING